MKLTRERACDLCGAVPKEIIDGRIKTGQWAWLCKTCWSKSGAYKMLGIGKGQCFENKKGGVKLEG